MDFVLNNIKYQISDLEVFVAYIIVDRYFEDSQYDIHFDFLDDFGRELTFEELNEGAELISNLNVNFLNPTFMIETQINGNFRISYQSISFSDIYVGEAIGVLIALNSLIEYRPAITLDEIRMEVDRFIETQRKKFISQ